MRNELRVFLLIRSPDGDLQIKVHRGLHTAVADWIEHARLHSTASAVVHAGHTRPETAEVEWLLAQHPGHVLVTEAARWLLPPAFREIGEPIGALFGTADRRALLLYLASKGWGYELDARPAASSIPAGGSGDNPIDTPEVGAASPEPFHDRWMRALAAERPDLAQVLREQQIASDEQYATGRHALSAEDRGVIDQFRFDALLPDVDPADPFALARILPEWLLQSEVKHLGLSVRCRNVLLIEGITTLAGLVDYSLDEALASWDNFGRKSVEDLAQTLRQLAAHPPPWLLARAIESGAARNAYAAIPDTVRGPDREKAATPSDVLSGEANVHLILRAHLDAFMDRTAERDAQIFAERTGRDGPRRRLEAIAQEMGITRERVRQLESRAFRRFSETGVPKRIASRIAALMRSRSDPLYVDLLEAEDTWFAGFADRIRWLTNLIREFAGSEWEVITVEQRPVITRISQDDWEDLRRSAIDYLKSNMNQGLTTSDVDLTLDGMAASQGAPELASLLRYSVHDHLHFVDSADGDTSVLAAVGTGTRTMIQALLAQSDHPLHFSEVARMLEQHTGKPVSPAMVNSNLQSIGILLGRGIYGLKHHFPLSKVEGEQVLEHVHELIAESPDLDRQWHAGELLELLSEHASDLPAALDHYVLNALLEQSSLLASLGRFVWVRRDASRTGEIARIDLADACVAVLERAGRPLRTEELRSGVEEVRGTGEHFMIQPGGRMTRLKSGLWGLVDRDFGLSAEQRRELTDMLHSVLTHQGKGLHLQELRETTRSSRINAPGRLTDSMILGLAQVDHRFAVARGQLLYLAEWEGPRRLSLAEAVRQIAEQAEGPLSMQQIIARVEARVERSVSPQEMYTPLKSVGMDHDSTTGAYSRAKEASSTMGDDDG